MSEALVTLKIDDIEITVPQGTLIVDAAKKAGIEIPVFCYHPKLHPAGMCRMCLVEIGRPKRDRATGELELDEKGRPVMAYGPNLETSCNLPVGEGWHVRVNSEKAIDGRRSILEFLLTSHPLDCPICDKGGECPLQNLTLNHGPGKSRFLLDDKMKLDKHVPLGELIFLDRERCIQCARCIRFQDEIVDDPVLSFSERGRHLEIITLSNPGFDSYFSGNTTDICPVGALTTADFRFGARPWELNAAASICPHCPVGCNLMLNTRREARAGGREVIKRVMPRQNEGVNEIWICDKGRFGHHFASSEERITAPLVRVGEKLVKAGWDQAIRAASEGLSAAGEAVVGIAGGRASNEDLFYFNRLMNGLGGQAFADETMAGGDLAQRASLARGSNLGDLGGDDAVLVIAADLHEEAPVWWMRIKQAAERGATLVVANARSSRLDDHATHLVRYAASAAPQAALGLLHGLTGSKDLAKYAGDNRTRQAAEAISQSRNLIVFYGAEGLDYAGSRSLANACAALVEAKDMLGKPNNGLVPVWSRGNSQGVWEMGLRPAPEGLEQSIAQAKAGYVIASDPAGDNPALAQALMGLGFLVVQELSHTETTKLADVVLPARSFIEREGTYTSGDRRVQRFYPAVPAQGESKTDWRIVAEIARQMGVALEAQSAAEVLREISNSVPAFEGLTYQSLSQVDEQWPHVGGADLFFGGTSYRNHQGLGIRLAAAPEGGPIELSDGYKAIEVGKSNQLIMVPITRLYDHGTTLRPSTLLDGRKASALLELNPEDASRLGVESGDEVEVGWDGRLERLTVVVAESVPERAALLPRSVGIAIAGPVAVEITAVK